MLGKIHQPIGHGEVVDVVKRTIALERGAILAVRVDHYDMAFGGHVANLVQD